MYLNTEEIASFWHFPLTVEVAPQLKWVKARSATAGGIAHTEGIILGEAVYQNQKR